MPGIADRRLRSDRESCAPPDKGVQLEPVPRRLHSLCWSSCRQRQLQMKLTDMTRSILLVFTLLSAGIPGISASSNDPRVLVELPEMMQQHMLSNMRDHLAAINEILVYLGNGELEKASDTAEYRLGMSSLESHGASHLAKFMPEGMREAGTSMHKAASRFALKAQEGDLLPAYEALTGITSACVACHSGYRVR